AISLYRTNTRVTGILTTFNLISKAASNFGKQTPPVDIGMEAFEFWCPQRRPEGQNLAIQIEPALQPFGAEQLKIGVYRPRTAPNGWVACLKDREPTLSISWQEPEEARQTDSFFGTAYDHPRGRVLLGHPEDVIALCVRNSKIGEDDGRVDFKKEGNYQ